MHIGFTQLAGSLAHLLQALIDWWQTCSQSATPAQWACTF
jgi:exodeoxyribonuclease V gamma subunit